MPDAKPFSPFLFLRQREESNRPAIWTLVYPHPRTGKKRHRSTGYREDQKAKADKVLQEFLLRRRRAVATADDKDDGPLTVRRWSKMWIATRTKKGISSVGEYQSQLDNHILPVIGHLRLEAVTVDNIGEVMISVADKGLAPKTRRNVYFTMHSMFERAVPRLLAVNPCAIDEDELPKKVDADPEWRDTAVFTREEIVQMLTDSRLPLDRRTYYAVLFLAGPRFGEVSALKVRHYDATLKPLGRLQIAWSYNSKTKTIKSTKAEKPRKVPVHPWLAQILGEWLAHGFEAFMGRPPLADDPLIPSRWWQTRTMPDRAAPATLRNRPYHTMFKRFLTDLETLGLRRRRQHDARRSFITLAQEDGAIREIVQVVTHGQPGGIMDVYSQFGWGALCAEVQKLQLAPPPAPENQGISPIRKPAESLEEGCHSGCQSEKAQSSEEVTEWAQQGSNTFPTAGRAKSSCDNGCKSADLPESVTRRSVPGSGILGHPRKLATWQPMRCAVEAALAALDRGRIDQAREALVQALEESAEVAACS